MKKLYLLSFFLFLFSSFCFADETFQFQKVNTYTFASEPQSLALALNGSVAATIVGNNIMLSKDYGYTWNKLYAFADKPSLMAMSHTGLVIAVTVKETLMVSQNGGKSWFSFRQFSEEPSSMSISADGNFIAVSTGNKLEISTIDEGIWFYSKVFGSDLRGVAINADAGTIAVIEDNSLILSRDGGMTWNTLSSFNEKPSSLAIDADGDKIAISLDSQILFTNNNCKDWISVCPLNKGVASLSLSSDSSMIAYIDGCIVNNLSSDYLEQNAKLNYAAESGTWANLLPSQKSSTVDIYFWPTTENGYGKILTCLANGDVIPIIEGIKKPTIKIKIPKKYSVSKFVASLASSDIKFVTALNNGINVNLLYYHDGGFSDITPDLKGKINLTFLGYAEYTGSPFIVIGLSDGKALYYDASGWNSLEDNTNSGVNKISYNIPLRKFLIAHKNGVVTYRNWKDQANKISKTLPIISGRYEPVSVTGYFRKDPFQAVLITANPNQIYYCKDGDADWTSIIGASNGQIPTSSTADFFTTTSGAKENKFCTLIGTKDGSVFVYDSFKRSIVSQNSENVNPILVLYPGWNPTGDLEMSTAVSKDAVIDYPETSLKWEKLSNPDWSTLGNIIQFDCNCYIGYPSLIVVGTDIGCVEFFRQIK